MRCREMAEMRRGNLRRFRVLALAVVLACLVPPASSGTVGFAETHSRLTYNELAQLHWVHPGDGCNQARTCFFLENAGKQAGFFRDLYGSMRRVSVPPRCDATLVMGEWSVGGWFVYDLRAERYVARSVSYPEALASWRANGLPDPTLAEATNLSRYFRETWQSRLESLTMLVLLLSPLIVLSLPVVLFLLVWSFLTFRRTKTKSFLALVAVLLVPAALGIFLLIRILAVLPKAR